MVQCLANLCCSKNTAQDQAVAADNLGEQGPCSVSESVSYPHAITTQHIVGDEGSSRRENGKRSRRPRISGAFTRQRKNGTDPTKTGTVPIVFAKKQ